MPLATWVGCSWAWACRGSGTGAAQGAKSPVTSRTTCAAGPTWDAAYVIDTVPPPPSAAVTQLAYEQYVVVDPKLYRPAEIDHLLGNSARPGPSLGGSPPRASRNWSG